jgi:hypothetical protein
MLELANQQKRGDRRLKGVKNSQKAVVVWRSSLNISTCSCFLTSEMGWYKFRIV